jgi:hypothetical protein
MLPFCDRRVSVARKDVAPVWTRSFPISKEPKTLGEHLKKKRFRMGMRQEEVARPTTIARYRDRLALKAEDEGWTGFTTKLVKTLLFAHRREKAPPAWAVFHFSRADWRVNFRAAVIRAAVNMAASFGFQNQPPLSRRRAPSTTASGKPPTKSPATGFNGGRGGG